MKVRELIWALGFFNPTADIKIIINNIKFNPVQELSCGNGDNVTPDNCEEVYIDIPLSNDESVKYFYKGEQKYE